MTSARKKKSIKKIIINTILVIAIIVSTSITFSFFRRNSFARYYNFSYSSCSGGVIANTNDVKSAYWKEDNLIIEPVYRANCKIKDLKETVKIENDKIYLNVDVKTGRLLAKCICNYDTKFKLKKLEKRDYEIVLQKNGEVVKNIYSLNDWIKHDKCLKNPEQDCYFENNIKN